MQNEYKTNPDAGRPGLIADLNSNLTATVKSDAVAYMGRLLSQDATGAKFHPAAASDITTKGKVCGVVVASFQAVNANDGEAPNHPVDTPFAVLRKGKIHVALDQDVALTDSVYVRFAENDGVNEVHSITPSAAPVSGDIVFSFMDESTTGIAFDATAGEIQTALRALTTIGAGNVTVTGTFATAVMVTFVGDLAAQHVELISVESTTFKSDAGTEEVQTLTPSEVPAKGSTKLAIGSELTDALAFDASAATITAALEAIVGEGLVTATGGFTTAVVVTFDASLGDVAAITTDTNTLAKADDTPVTLENVETHKGVVPASVTVTPAVETIGEEKQENSVGMFRADDDDPSGDDSDPKAALLSNARYVTTGVKGGTAVVDLDL